MKSLFPTLALLLIVAGVTVTSGCAGSDAAEVEALKRRIANLETRTKQLESLAGVPGGGAQRGAKSRQRGSAASKPGEGGTRKTTPTIDPSEGAELTLTGDALKVMVTIGQRRMAPRGVAPAGEATVLAQFTEGQAPVQAGTGTLTAGSKVTINCDSASQTCSFGPTAD